MYCRIKAIVFLFIVLLLESLMIHWIQCKIEFRIHLNEKEIQSTTEINNMITKDMLCFPIAKKYKGNISFEDSFGAYRENGNHEGCDIMYDANETGMVPIISATNGTVTNLGWLYLGGYRVGITSDNGVYYYYAHFDSCAPSLYVGKKVNAGEFLGFMGNTGQGEEGTKGKFPVHLHFGIYVEEKNGKEISVNPYHFLLKINEE